MGTLLLRRLLRTWRTGRVDDGVAMAVVEVDDANDAVATVPWTVAGTDGRTGTG